MKKLTTFTKIIVTVLLLLLNIAAFILLPGEILYTVINLILFIGLFIFAFASFPTDENGCLFKTISFIIVFILTGLFVRMCNQSSNDGLFDYRPKALIKGKTETIWEIHHSDNLYGIRVIDPETGKKIALFEQKTDTIYNNIHIVQANNKVWIIGTGRDKPPLIDVYDVDTYEKIYDFEKLCKINHATKAGFINSNFPHDNLFYDNMYTTFVGAPQRRIIELKSNTADNYFLDIYTEKLYESEALLFWDLCLAGYDMIKHFDKHIFYLAYANDSLMSRLYVWTPESPVGIYFYNTLPYKLGIRNDIDWFSVKSFLPEREFHNAKTVYQDKDGLFVFHYRIKENEDKPIIEWFSAKGESIAEIDITKFELYNETKNYSNFTINPYSIRKGDSIMFRIKYLGCVIIDIANRNQTFENETIYLNYSNSEIKYAYGYAYTSNSNVKLIYASTNKTHLKEFAYRGPTMVNEKDMLNNPELKQLLSDFRLINPKILYTCDDFVILYYSTRLGEDPIYEMICVSPLNKVLFRLKNNEFPNYTKFDEKECEFKKFARMIINDPYFTKLEFYRDNHCLIILFEEYGAIKINLKTGEKVWKYKV